MTLKSREQDDDMITAEESGLEYVFDETFDNLITAQNPYLWGLHLTGHEDYLIAAMGKVDPEAFDTLTGAIACLQESSFRAPEDAKVSDKVLGYMARMDLINGFSKTIFWTKEEVEAHANKFSQAFRAKKGSPWQSDFDAMARKTVLKALFAKYAPKSVAIQQAIKFDQAVVKPNDTLTEEDLQIDSYDVDYVDNEPMQDAVAEEVKPQGDLFGDNKTKKEKKDGAEK